MHHFVKFALAGLCLCLLASCGFALRGLENPVLGGDYVRLLVEDEVNHRDLVKQATVELMVLGASVESSYNQLNKASRPHTEVLSDDSMLVVSVSDISFKKIQPMGTLTEVQLVLDATISIKAYNKAPLVRDVQVLRTYQYDEATVNTRNQQEGIIIKRMNAELAARIARQLSLFKISLAKTNSTKANALKVNLKY